MIADDFRDLRICETRILSDYGLLVVLAVKNKSCRMVCQKSGEIHLVTAVRTTTRRLGMMEVKRQLAERKCTYRFLVVEPLDPADRDRSSLAYLLATSLLHFS